MRFTTSAIACLMLAVANAAGAAAEPSPSPLPSAAALVRLSDQEIRDALVGNRYFAPWKEGMILEVEVHTDGTLSGRVSDRGYIPRGISAAARNQDDGRYVITGGRLCLSYSGAWANANGKPTCHTVWKGDKGYSFGGTTPIDVVPSKK
jgi:hypothetical protein